MVEEVGCFSIPEPDSKSMKTCDGTATFKVPPPRYSSWGPTGGRMVKEGRLGFS